MSRRTTLTALALLTLGVVLTPSGAHAQCILANPSFELGTGGWELLGNVGTVSDAVHGSSAARVTGLNLGGWDVSAYRQQMDSEPGEQWEVTVHVQNSSANPLGPQSSAIVNVEWWSSTGMISYESHAAADASTPTGEYREFSFTSGPAPSGTVATRLLLGVLQAPSDPRPDVYYDQATFYSLSSPTMDEMQWNDFPGGRTVDFADRTWRVKGPGWYGPGPSSFSDSPSAVWVDAYDQLHLTITHASGQWWSTEVTLEEALGYGDYIFTTKGQLDQFDPHTVFGLFLWQYGPCWDESYLWWNPYDEFDIEFSHWNDPGGDFGQFVAQPYDYPGNISRFDISFSEDEITSHAFRWIADGVECRSWRGGPYDESPGTMIHSWTYAGPHIPRPEQPRVHLNLWQYDGAPATEQEVIISDFTFVPEGWTDVPDGPIDGASSPFALLLPARPNPFNPTTTLAYELREGADVTLDVFDVSGRGVRRLVRDFRPAGRHDATWDGRNDAGESVASGVYFYSLRAGDVLDTRRMVLVK
ncbi:MAG: T9SS type A sorting domain-containing protein [Candidatus Eisenbacteria bacterium]|nr:T9SS type A sorting domain-containing protein [Candidatus Eisenbacteria bacterium]